MSPTLNLVAISLYNIARYMATMLWNFKLMQTALSELYEAELNTLWPFF